MKRRFINKAPILIYFAVAVSVMHFAYYLPVKAELDDNQFEQSPDQAFDESLDQFDDSNLDLNINLKSDSDSDEKEAVNNLDDLIDDDSALARSVNKEILAVLSKKNAGKFISSNSNINIKGETTKSTLSLEEAINQAVNQNPNLKSKNAEVDISKAAIKTAGARPNPFLEGIESRAENAYSGGINYLFELGGKRKKRMRAAEKEFHATEKDYEATEHDLRIAVRRLYSELAVDLERLKGKENSLSLAQELVNITRKRYEAGDVPSVDIKIAEQALLNGQSDLLNIKSELSSDRISLNLLIVLESLKEWFPSTSIQELSDLKTLKAREELIKLAIKNRADLQKAEFDIQAAKAHLDVAKANRIPNIQENFAIVASNGLAVNNNSPDVFTVNVRTDTSVELPVLNMQKGPIAEAQAKIRKLNYDKEALIERVKSEITSADEKIKTTREKIELAKQTVDSSQEIANLMQKGYLAGRMSIMQVLSSRQNLKQAQDNYYSTILDFQQSISNLENALDLPAKEAEL